MELPIENLEEIAALLDGTSIEMLEIKEGNIRVKFAKAIAYPKPAEIMPIERAADVKAEEGLYTVKSYMVGTFRRSNELGGKPLIEEGDKVNLDSTLYVIEAMKMLNEVKLKDYKDFNAKGGVVHKILIKDEPDVEFGTPLFQIIPKGE